MFDQLQAVAKRVRARLRGGSPTQRTSACTLVAIARNEGRYIGEWLAFHLAIGVSRIIVFDQGSDDDTAAVVARAAAREGAISLRHCAPQPGQAPQLAAYEEGLASADTPWIAFLDIDEFLVPWRDGSLPAFLARVPREISTVHVNWRAFGSSGRIFADYELVTEVFTRCAEPDWTYQKHYKTIARRDRIIGVDVHDVEIRGGQRVMSDLAPAAFSVSGIATRIVYDGIQINHYQSKTRAEFFERMSLPRANHPIGNPEASRMADRELRYGMLDRNETEDRCIQDFLPRMMEQRRRLQSPPSS